MNSLYVLRMARRVWSSKVSLQPLTAAFPAVPGFLVPAERRGRVELVEGVGPHHAGAQLVGDGEDPRTLLGPDPGGQPVRRVVRLLHRLGRGAEREYRQDRAEDLLAGDPVRLRDTGENRRYEPESALRQFTRSGPALRTLRGTGFGQLADPGQLRGRVDGAHVGVLVQRVADPQRRHPPLERVEYLVGHRLLDQQPGTRAAHVPLVEEDAVDDALDRLVDRSVVEHDVGGLPAQLQGQPFPGTGDRLRDGAADLGRAGE